MYRTWGIHDCCRLRTQPTAPSKCSPACHPPVANTWEGKARHLPIVEVSEVIGCTPYEWMVDFMENPSMEI